MSIKSVMPSHPLLLLPSVFPRIRVFSSESVLLIRWPKYWSFSFSISTSNEYSALISFRVSLTAQLVKNPSAMTGLISLQRTLKSLLQHYSLKASIIWHSAFFMVQFSHSYMTTGKNSFDYTYLCWQNDVSAF